MPQYVQCSPDNCNIDCSLLLDGECPLEDEILELFGVTSVDDLDEVAHNIESDEDNFDRAMDIFKSL